MVYDEHDPMDTYPYRHQKTKSIEQEFNSSLKAIVCWLVLIVIVLLFYCIYKS